MCSLCVKNSIIFLLSEQQGENGNGFIFLPMPMSCFQFSQVCQKTIVFQISSREYFREKKQPEVQPEKEYQERYLFKSWMHPDPQLPIFRTKTTPNFRFPNERNGAKQVLRIPICPVENQGTLMPSRQARHSCKSWS